MKYKVHKNIRGPLATPLLNDVCLKLTFYNRHHKWNQETELNDNAKLFRCYHFTLLCLTWVTINNWSIKLRNYWCYICIKESMSTDVGLLFQIFCEPGKINTQIGNADQRSIYVKSATCNKCKLQMFDLILIRYTYFATANTFLLLKQWHHKRLFCLAMLCIECVDVRKDNCHTFSFFICLLCIIFAIDFFIGCCKFYFQWSPLHAYKWTIPRRNKTSGFFSHEPSI